MKDHIHTIPVLDALREPGYCPFCNMYNKLDENAVDFIMGPAYMDEDIRDKTNEAGFCEKHLIKLYAVQNRLGAALLIHTHLKQLHKNMKTSPPQGNPAKKTGFFSGRQREATALPQERCYICEKIDDTFSRYISTFFYMWPREAEVVELVKALPGFCLPHYNMIISAAGSALSNKHLDGFYNVVVPLQDAAMKKLDEDLDWFIQKFDYRNADAPWKDSKDALMRSVAMLKGVIVE